MPRPVPHKKHTNLGNEITGSYHNDKEASWLRFAVTTIIVVSLFAALLILGEQTGLTSKLFGTV